MEVTNGEFVREGWFGLKELMILVGAIGVIVIVWMKMASKKKINWNVTKSVKTLNIKQKVDIRVHKAVENMQTDLKSFEGLKHNEIDAITEKNTQLNSGSRISSSKSISEISIEKLDDTWKSNLLTLNNISNCKSSNSFDDLRSISTFTSINSEESLPDDQINSNIDCDSKKWHKTTKRVSFNW